MRVCLDTNVLDAAFATRGLCSDVLRTVLTERELILGDIILEEFRRVLVRKLRLPEDRVAAAEAVFSTIQIVPRPDQPSPISVRDQDDSWILATAISGRAAVLVTGDDDLLAVVKDAPFLILPPRAFWELLRKGGSR